jgi:cytoskeletal protein RodZ
MASIGQELKRERELRGISLKEIAEATKINLRFLRALEEDRFDMLPEKFFTRGIIRTYAKYLGLDEQVALNTYIDSLHNQSDQGMPESSNKVETDTKSDSEENTKKISRLFTLMVLAIIALIVIMYFVLRKEKNPPPDSTKKQPAVHEIQKKPSPPPPVFQEEPETEPQELNIEILVQQETWLEIYADQVMVESGIKLPGDRFRFKAFQEFLIHIGNAGGIEYTLNGQEGKKFGEPGDVRRDIQITLENFEDYFAEKE